MATQTIEDLAAGQLGITGYQSAGPLPVPAAPATGPVTEPASQGITPTSADPSVGTPSRAVRVSTFPQVILRLGKDIPALENKGLLPNDFVVPAPGHLWIAGAVETAAVLQVSVDGGVQWIPVNDNQALPANAWWSLADPLLVGPGDEVDMSFATATTILAWRVVYVPSVGR